MLLETGKVTISNELLTLSFEAVEKNKIPSFRDYPFEIVMYSSMAFTIS